MEFASIGNITFTHRLHSAHIYIYIYIRRLRSCAWELELNKMKARETEFSNSKVFATNLNIKGMSLAGSMFATRLKVGSNTRGEDSMKNLVVSKLSNTSSVLARNASSAHWHLNK